MAENSSNITFIKSIFAEEQVAKNFPQYNYRLRLAGLTEFEPYISEAPRVQEETDGQYQARVLTSGMLFGEQDILLDDLVHSEQNILNLQVNSQFLDGKIPRTLLFLEKCKLINDGKEYEVNSKNLNNLGCVQHGSPFVTFPVENLTTATIDGTEESTKGYIVLRKTTTVNKDDAPNSSLVDIVSGWHEVTGFSSLDLIDKLGDESASVADRIKAAGFVDSHTKTDENGLSVKMGYESLQNELFTQYKVLDSGDYKDLGVISDREELTKKRTIDITVDPSKTYSLQRRVNRDSNDDDNPAEWKTIDYNATFPYEDDENLTDYINTNVNFEVSGVYETVETTGSYATSQDYFEVDLLRDWGKGDPEGFKEEGPSTRQKSDEMTFRNGESLKVNQRSTYRAIGPLRSRRFDQYNSIDLNFSPFSTGAGACFTGDANDKNFYQLEYQFIPTTDIAKRLYYETGESSLNVGQEVFYNTGAQDDGSYTPVVASVVGETPSVISQEATTKHKGAVIVDENRLGPSYLINSDTALEPEAVAESIVSGVGYSYFTSGEKYIVLPKGGYNTAHSDSNLEYTSAGETFKVFFQGEQSDDEKQEYILTEYSTFNDTSYMFEFLRGKQERFIAKRSRDIRMSEKALCLGDSSSELQDEFLPKPSFVLDPARKVHETYVTLSNGSLLNIDGSDGSVKIDNLKNNKEQFERRSNLFFEKNYVASLTVLATGQQQNIDSLSQFMEDGVVYYLERDIYIDSEVDSQANTFSPPRSSDEKASTLSPFSVNEFTRNPESVGQEKLYLTQTYHTERTNKPKFPYSDYDYYNLQPTVSEEYTYDNLEKNIIDDFDLVNASTEKGFLPGIFECSLASSRGKEPHEGFSVLMSTGYYVGSASSDPAHETDASLSVANYNAGDKTADVTFTPSNKGSYYEIQHRADAQSAWQTISHAIEATSESAMTESVNGVSNETVANYRIVEWFTSPVVTDFREMTFASESPDSLILKSAASHKFYDLSKFSHNISQTTTNGVTTSQVTWGGTNVYQMVFDGNNANYLQISFDDGAAVSRSRAFNILPGEFSFEFWIKGYDNGSSNNKVIFERSGVFKIYMHDQDTLKIDLKGTTYSYSLSNNWQNAWKHIAIAKVVERGSENEPVSKLYLYDEGERTVLEEDAQYDGFKASNSSAALVIGQGLSANLYQPRIYIGQSIYRGLGGVIPKSDFDFDPLPRRYKILKFNYSRHISPLSSWVINKNTFNNVNPPDDYHEENEGEATQHMSEWMLFNSSLQNRSISRAQTNYISSYAYRAPNNPHINKNYEGEPIVVDNSSGSSGPSSSAVFSRVKLDNYHYRTRNSKRSVNRFNDNKAPYYYEYLGNSSIENIRLGKKGGEDSRLMPFHSSKNSSFEGGSRLRVTKYVYKLYTKDAVIISDTGFKNSRSAQGGWAYQLQYSLDSGSNWTDVDSVSSYEDYFLFLNDDYSGGDPNSFGNINHAYIVPTLINKTDITKKYKPEEIEFRVEKRQKISISSTSSNAEVIKKLNFMPLEISVPTTGTLLDITQKAANDEDSSQASNYTEIDDSQGVVHLDPNETYIVHKDSSEKILLSSDTSDEMKVQSLSIDDTFSMAEGGQPSSTSEFSNMENNKPYEVTNLTGLRIYNADSAIDSTEKIKTVVGLRPSGLILNRVEKSFGEPFIKTGESVGLDGGQTRLFFTPSITGTHFEGLEAFSTFDIYGHTSGDVDYNDGQIINFSCSSFVTGGGGVSIETGVSGVSYRPVHEFYNSPYITGSFEINSDDKVWPEEDKLDNTFLLSGGDFSIQGKDYSFDVINIDDDDKAAGGITFSEKTLSTVTVDSAGTASKGTETPIESIVPVVKNDSSDDEASLVILDDLSTVHVSDSRLERSAVLANISTGSCFVASDQGSQGSQDSTLGSLQGVTYLSDGTKESPTLSGVVLFEHDKIRFTDSDANITGVIDTDSKVYLPDGFNDSEHITLLNSTNHDVEVVSDSNFKIDSKPVDFIPKNKTRKFTYSSSAWTTSDIDVIKYNQLSVANSNDGDVFIHNEDVDVRIDSASTSTGFSFSVLRSQVKGTATAKLPIMRVFVDDELEYVAGREVLGLRIEKKSYGWAFENIPLLTDGGISVGPQSHGKVYSMEQAEGIGILFEESNDYPQNFEIFLTSQNAVDEFTVNLSAENDFCRFAAEGKEEDVESYETSISRSNFVKISKVAQGADDNEKAKHSKFYVNTVSSERANKHRLSHPGNSKTQVAINYQDDFAFELPTLGGDFNTAQGYNAILINNSESSMGVVYPDNADKLINTVFPFGSVESVFKKGADVSNYDNLQLTNAKSPRKDNFLVDGDVAIFDGSLSALDIKRFLELKELVGIDQEVKKVHKYSIDTSSKRISPEGNDKFNLLNHDFVSGQKITFDSKRLTIADYYYEIDDGEQDDDIEYFKANWNGVVTGATSIAEGESLLVWLQKAGEFFYFTYKGGKLEEASFFMADVDSGLRETGAKLKLNDKLAFVYINKDSNEAGVDAGEVFALQQTKLSAATAEAAGTSLAANLDFTDNKKAQTYYIQVINENSFYLHTSNSLSDASKINVTGSSDFYFFSEFFKVENLGHRSATILNVGAEETSIKKFSDQQAIGGGLGALDYNDYRHDTLGNFSSGDLAESGIHVALGYDSTNGIDTNNITKLQAVGNQILASGEFTAKAALTDNDFDNDIMINGSDEEVVMYNTNDASQDTFSKKRIYKHGGNGSFTVQNFNTSNREAIYYPSNEAHIPDRKNLGFDSAATPFGYDEGLLNFVIYDFIRGLYDKNDIIVLPDSFSNLGNVAILNVSNMPVKVVNFSRTLSVTIDALKGLLISNASNYGVNPQVPLTATSTDYGNELGFSIGLEKYSILLGEVISFEDGEDGEYSGFDARPLNAIKQGSKVDSFYLTAPNRIFYDHEIHNGKDIIVEKDFIVTMPYLYNPDGTDDYRENVDPEWGNWEYRPTGNSDSFSNFNIINVSTKPIRLIDQIELIPVDNNKSDNVLHSRVTYKAQIENFKTDDDLSAATHFLDDYDYFRVHATIQFKSLFPLINEQREIEYPAVSLDKEKTHHVFGKEIQISLDVYYRKSEQKEMEETNFVLKPDESKEADDYYRLVGLGSEGNSTLNIINHGYENLKISSVEANFFGGHNSERIKDTTDLNSELLGYFDSKPVNEQYSLWGYSDGQLTSFQRQNVYKNYLEKGEILKLSIKDLIKTKAVKEIVEDEDGNPADEEITSIEYSEDCLFDKDRKTVSEEQVDLINRSVHKVRYIIKEDEIIQNIEPEQGPQENDVFIQKIVKHGANIYLPSLSIYINAYEGDSQDFYFTLVNASRHSCSLVDPTGTVSATMAAGTVKRIKGSYSSFAITYSDVSSNATYGIEAVSLGNSLYYSKTGEFLASNVNSSSTPLLLNSSLKDIKILNNTSKTFHIRHVNHGSGGTIDGSSGVYELPADCYVDLTTSGGANFNILNKNKNIEFSKVDVGLNLDRNIYENKVVYFDSSTVEFIKFDSDSFFNTTLVPFIDIYDYLPRKSKDDIESRKNWDGRTKSFAVGYTVTNRTQDPIKITTSDAATFTSSGQGEPISPLCHVNEFVLDTSVNNKVILAKKFYHYTFKNNQSTGFSIYSVQREDDRYSYEFRRLDSNNEKYQSEDAVQDVHPRVMLSCSQNGNSNPSITELQTYKDSFYDIKFKGEDKVLSQKGASKYSSDPGRGGISLFKSAYLNKSSYTNKILIFKDSYDIFYNAGNDKKELLYANIGRNPCYVYDDRINAKLDSSDESQSRQSTLNPSRAFYEGVDGANALKREEYDVIRPKHFIEGANYVITQPADVEASSDTFKLMNASRSNIDVSINGESSTKLYSSERVDFSSGDASYGLCPRYNKRDWFLKLKSADIQNLIKDIDYYDEVEDNAQSILRKEIMVDYIGARYKFSNMFQTNYYQFGIGSGYDSIEHYNTFYKFGVTLYGNKKDGQKSIIYDKNPIDYIANGLKLSWNMPHNVIAYSLNTGHERLCHCKKFDERNNLVTFGGIEANREYALEDFDASNYNFVSDSQRLKATEYPFHKYGRDDATKEELDIDAEGTEDRDFQPVVIYMGKEYAPGEKFRGVAGHATYSIKYHYYALFKSSQFVVDLEEDQAEEDKELFEAESKEISEELEARMDSADHDIQSPQWSVVTSQDDKDEFVAGEIIDKVSSGDSVELIKGRRLGDIDGEWIKQKVKVSDEDSQEEVFQDQYYFEFVIPKKDGVSPSLNIVDSEPISLREDGEGNSVIRVGFNKDDYYIEYPGYEYEIKSEFTFPANSLTGGDASKVAMVLAVSSDKTLVFRPDGVLKSLDLDFKKDATQGGFSEVNTDHAGHDHSTSNTYASDFEKRVRLVLGNRMKTLKNNIGYAFLPFDTYAIRDASPEFFGINLISSRGKQRYDKIRFRLKKLTERKLVFEDLKTDDKVGAYLTNNASSTSLQYYLDTEVNSISYHDIAKPGGVVKQRGSWVKLSQSGENKNFNGSTTITSETPVRNGDSVLLKSDGGVYFIKVTAYNDATELYSFRLLKIFTKEDYDNIGNDNTVTLTNEDHYKIVNYFDLATEPDGTHRAEPSVLKKIYKVEQADENAATDPLTTLSYPICISNLTFFLEAPFTDINDDDISVDKWGGEVYSGDTVRANLELSTVAKYWNAENSGGQTLNNYSWENVDKWPDGTVHNLEMYINPNHEDATIDNHWSQIKDIFLSFKNLLYRPNCAIDTVNYKDNVYTYNVKLNKNIEYRYIYRKHHSIKSAKIGSTDLSEGTNIIQNTEENLQIVINGENTTEQERKQIIYSSICFVEGVEYINSEPHSTKYTSDEANMSLDYFDYQLPVLNDEEPLTDNDNVFKNVNPSYKTEGYQSLLTYTQKRDNLTTFDNEAKPITGRAFANNLFYDMGMPATCQYIYATYSDKYTLSYTIRDFWQGFEKDFDGEAANFFVKPERFKCDLQKYNSNTSTWDDFDTGLDSIKDKYKVKTKKEINDTDKYRLKITKAEISYVNKNLEIKIANNSALRIPFKWTSTIIDSKLGSSVNGKYSINLSENDLIGKSVSFPKSGTSTLGEFHYIKKNSNLEIDTPYTRLYMINFDHSMRASYKDKINRGGISKVVLLSKGANYRTAPTVTIAAPDEGQQAKGRATIEDGKIKFIEVTNGGHGYVDLSDKQKNKRIEQHKVSSMPVISQATTIGNKNTYSEKGLEYITEGVAETWIEQQGLTVVDVTLTGNESSLPKEYQEEFGLTRRQTDSIDDYYNVDDVSSSNSKPKVDFMVGSSEDNKTWSDIQDQADRIQSIGNFVNQTLSDLQDQDFYGDAVEQDEREIKGTESSSMEGYYNRGSTDYKDDEGTKNTSQLAFDANGSIRHVVQFETHPAVVAASAKALANNGTLADYRVIPNKVIEKTTPWISSFSREDNSDLPESFGLVPGANLTSEVFNTYARAVNFMSRITVNAPVYAKIRRFKRIEYRYISNPVMAGLEFASDDDSKDAGESRYLWGNNETTFDYLSYENKSKVNYIVYFDPSDNKTKRAYFSAFTADGAGTFQSNNTSANIEDYNIDKSKIWDENDDKLVDEENFKELSAEFTPTDVGFPNTVNINKEVGVYCNPPAREKVDKGFVNPIKGEGLPLPTTLQKRAYAYGGEILNYATSRTYDVSEDQFPFHKGSQIEVGEVGSHGFEPILSELVDIRGSDYIQAGYENKIVFGCQTKDKPFLSAFLETTKVWTEYEIIADNEFILSLPEELRDKYRPEEADILATSVTKKYTCSNDVIGKVDYENGGYHSICSNGKKGSYVREGSYEAAFDLSDGDEVVGPKYSSQETAEGVRVSAKGVFEIEPEFNLALAVYEANKYVKAVRRNIHNPNDYLGPCVHHCMPGEIKTLYVPEDNPLILDLMKK